VSTTHTYALVAEALERSRTQRRQKRLMRFITSILVNLVGALIGGFCLMIAVGTLHADWWADIPPMGYWRAVVTVALLRGVFSRIPESKDQS